MNTHTPRTYPGGAHTTLSCEPRDSQAKVLITTASLARKAEAVHLLSDTRADCKFSLGTAPLLFLCREPATRRPDPHIEIGCQSCAVARRTCSATRS